MTEGERFNPFHKACGFFPADVVGRARKLRDGAKRAYALLIWHAGQDGRCFPSLKKLAEELGKSIPQVSRDLAKLEGVRLIEHSRGGRGKTNRYFFLWHAMFSSLDQSHVSNQTAKQNDPSRSVTSASLIDHICNDDRSHVIKELQRKPSGNRQAKAKASRAASAQQPPPSPTPSPSAPLAAAPASEPNPRAIEIVLADLAVPDRHLRTARRLLEGENPSELPKVPRLFAQRLAAKASQFLGRPIAPKTWNSHD